MNRWRYIFVSICLFSVSVSGLRAGETKTTTLPNPILFVTQVPFATDTSTITSVFANHLPTTKSCGRGGDLYIIYPDGTLKNLTALAGFGTSGFQGATGIAVREPSVHWSGTKAVFSMLVGSPLSASDSTQFFWQLYEITGLGEFETPVITIVPNQPSNYNNTNPVYGTDERIIFSSDRPHNGAAHLYPLLDEYRGELANAGIYSLDPASGDLMILDHAPSGDFRPFLDSYGRIIFSRWDHLQRDSQADKDSLVGNTFGSFNYSDETATATVLQGDRTEYYPEPQSARTDELAGMNVNGFEFNHFIPWQMNEDGSEMETINHVGRHDLNFAIGKSFTDDPNLVNYQYTAGSRVNTNSVNNFLDVREDPTNAGLFYGVDCMENGVHGAGQIVTLTGAPSIDAQDMVANYITDRNTAFFLAEGGSPNATYTGHYRDPLPLSNGTLLCSHTTENRLDKNLGTYSNPVSRYNFRITTMQVRTGSILMANQPITQGIVKTVSYYSDSGLVSLTADTMWELNPVEVVARAKPTRRVAQIGTPELNVMAEEAVDTTEFRNYLIQHNLAVIVSRNITNRNTFDHQQPFYLKVHNSSTQSPNPTGKVYDVNYLQLFEGDHIRGYGLVNGNTNPRPGRRVLARPLSDTTVHNPPNPGGPAGSVVLGGDGSQAAFVPAHRAMTWQLTDSTGLPVVRERFWVSFRPGEVRTCASCHGSNGEAAVPKQIIPQNEPEALHTLLQYWKSFLAPPPPGSHTYSVTTSWNLISLPLTVPDGRKTVLFPSAITNAFSYNGSYHQADTLFNGNGYWVKFSSNQNVHLSGTLLTQDSIDVVTGWNLIGSIGSAVAVTSVGSVPPALVTSNFFGYNGSSYTIADSIRPAQGYWVKVSAPGKLVLSSSGAMAAKSRVHIVPTTELPPLPPGGELSRFRTLTPNRFSLEQNYPNPFNPSTDVRFDVPVLSFVSLKVYDLLGREVATLIQEQKSPGQYHATWDASNVPSGVYFYKFEAGAFTDVKKMVLMK